MSTLDIQYALANEARRNELRQRTASLRGEIKATASAVSRLSSINNDASEQLRIAQAELTALEAGAGPGITDDFGSKSSVTRALEAEREAAKSACIDFVKVNPTCTEEQALTAWDEGAVFSHPEFAGVYQSGLALSQFYRQRLLAAGLITDATWEQHRDWIAATPKDTIMGL